MGSEYPPLLPIACPTPPFALTAVFRGARPGDGFGFLITILCPAQLSECTWVRLVGHIPAAGWGSMLRAITSNAGSTAPAQDGFSPALGCGTDRCWERGRELREPGSSYELATLLMIVALLLACKPSLYGPSVSAGRAPS